VLAPYDVEKDRIPLARSGPALLELVARIAKF